MIVPTDGIVQIEAEIIVTVWFTEPPGYDGGSAVWDWGDGSFTVQDDVTSPAQATHAYSEAGTFTIVVTVTDDSTGLSDTGTYEFIVVYDPSGGFVTGGGWIDSPAGAYVPDPTLSGQATFGFVSKYTKNKLDPTGNTNFQFKSAGLNFSSSHYDWLVVTGGSDAIFKGAGTINGQKAPNSEPYKFKVWASDGDPDTFRIRIWWEPTEDTEDPIYDSPDNHPIGGGSIVVQKGKGK